MTEKQQQFRPSPSRVPEKRPGKAGGKRAQNRKKRTQALCEAALPLFLEHGLERVTIDDIAKAAGVAKGSFYRYFADKVDLVAALFASVTADIDRAFAQCSHALSKARTRDQLNGAYAMLAGSLGATMFGSPDPVRLYLQEARGPGVGSRVPIRALHERIHEGAIELTRVAREHGLLRPVDSRVSARAVVGAVENLIFAHLSGEDLGGVMGVTDTLVTLVLDGLRPR